LLIYQTKFHQLMLELLTFYLMTQPQNYTMFRNQAILAPMAGITDSPFRQIVKSFGANLIHTEMISAEGIIRNQKNTTALLSFNESERPIIIQLFGSNPQSLAAAVKYVKTLQPIAIDLNAGCPVPKVIKSNAGAALMKDLQLLRTILHAMTDAAEGIPITIKLRLGWDFDNINILEAIGIAEECDVAGITIHARTRSQGYSGKAQWQWLAQAKKHTKIPIIGSGDIWNITQAMEMQDITLVDSILVARGIQGKPWLVSQIQAAMDKKPIPPEPSLKQALTVALHHLDLAQQHYGKDKGICVMRKHLVWYTKGWNNTKQLREKLIRIRTADEVKLLFADYLNWRV
jgi:tRNA-dihydrouridine synthase B